MAVCTYESTFSPLISLSSVFTCLGSCSSRAGPDVSFSTKPLSIPSVSPRPAFQEGSCCQPPKSLSGPGPFGAQLSHAAAFALNALRSFLHLTKTCSLFKTQLKCHLLLKSAWVPQVALGTLNSLCILLYQHSRHCFEDNLFMWLFVLLESSSSKGRCLISVPPGRSRHHALN